MDFTQNYSHYPFQNKLLEKVQKSLKYQDTIIYYKFNIQNYKH